MVASLSPLVRLLEQSGHELDFDSVGIPLSEEKCIGRGGFGGVYDGGSHVAKVIPIALLEDVGIPPCLSPAEVNYVTKNEGRCSVNGASYSFPIDRNTGYLLSSTIGEHYLGQHLCDTPGTAASKKLKFWAYKLPNKSAGIIYAGLLLDKIEGQTLDEANKSGSLSVLDKLSLCVDLGNIITEIWTHGIVHRDIKPKNIIVAGSPKKRVPVLLDFGNACLADGKGYPIFNDLHGWSFLNFEYPIHLNVTLSPGYAAPELASPDIAQRTSMKADLFSYGIIVTELLTGEKVFPKELYTDPDVAAEMYHNSDVFSNYPAVVEALVSNSDYPLLAESLAKAIDNPAEREMQPILDILKEYISKYGFSFSPVASEASMLRKLTSKMGSFFG